YCTAVDHGAMPDGAATPDFNRTTRIGMHHRQFLHVAAFADRDQFIVSTQHGAEPHAAVPAETYTPHHLRVRSDPDRICIVEFVRNAVDRVEGHRMLLQLPADGSWADKG